MLSVGLWKTTLFGIGAKFGDVKQIETEEVAKKIEEGDKIQLMDCREENEFQVSHIQGSENVNPSMDDTSVRSKISTIADDVDIICYCSVGYRSCVIAQKIQATGRENVYNMKGSIFKWANEGREVVDSVGNVTKFVHPYNSVWGQMLNKELWSDI